MILLSAMLVSCGPEADSRSRRIDMESALTSEAGSIDAAYRATSAAANAQSTATAAAVSIRATATSAAVAAQATQDANQWQATATAAAWLLSIQATQTAVPNQDFINSVQNSNMAARQWILSVIVVFFGSIAFVSAGFAGAAWLRTRSKIVPRDASGQLPGVLIGNTLSDMQRAIGPAVTMPQEPGLLWNLARMVRYVRTGEVLPVPESYVRLTDGGASADHYLEAARQAAQVTTAAAIFRPGDPKERKDKIELLVKKDGGRLLGAGRMPEVKLVDDPQKVAEFRKVLELESGE